MYVQGNFFQNIGSITLFAVIGTAISAFIVGGGIFFLGQVRTVIETANCSGIEKSVLIKCIHTSVPFWPSQKSFLIQKIGLYLKISAIISVQNLSSSISSSPNNMGLFSHVFLQADVIYKMSMTDRYVRVH